VEAMNVTESRVTDLTLALENGEITGSGRGAGMSSTDLNNEDYFSDRPKRLPSFDDLFRGQPQLTPERFFRSLERQHSGEVHCSQEDFQRAAFLFERLQSARRIVSRVILFLVVVSIVPFACLALPEEWRLSVFVAGIFSEFVAAWILFVAHARWQARRKDYCQWLKLVQRRVNDL
jgi:hypothetical protein